MARGRGNRAALEEVGQDLNLIPYMDIMVNLVLFLLITITSFLSFTILNASIPQLAPNAASVAVKNQKAQLLLMVRVTRKGFRVDPNVQGARSIKTSSIRKVNKEFDFESLRIVVEKLKKKFPKETRVLIVAERNTIYDDIIKTMDAVREVKAGDEDLFPDVTLSIL